MSEEKNFYDLAITTTNLANEQNSDTKQEPVTVKVYRRRYWMLFLFSILSLLCGMVFPQYVSIADVNICYYNISTSTLNWTVNMFYLGYVILVFPASYCMNYVGLRWTVIAGALSNTAACALQFSGLSPEGFPFILVSTVFGSISNLLVLAIPPFLAATWFPTNELSRGCAAGVFGNQLGVAAGYLFPPLMVSNNCSDKYLIQQGKTQVTTILTSLNVLWLILVIFTFQSSPKCPPTLHQVRKEVPHSHYKSVLGMFKNLNFVLLFIMYGLMVGSYFALTTVLNNLVLRYFPHREVEIGWMGTLFIVAGLVGSMIAGTVLDYTHRFKETALCICIASLITFIIFCSLLAIKKLWVTFLTIIIFGFFLTSFLPVGIEYGIELTFPEPEVISASLLNAATMLFSFILTEITSHLLENFGQIYSNISLAVYLLISVIITIFLTSKYKRSKKHTEEADPHTFEENVEK